LALVGTVVGWILNFVVWSILLPSAGIYAASKGAMDSVVSFIISTTLLSIFLILCMAVTGMILTALGEPLTDWSWGWPGYVYINYAGSAIN
jgi:riboflavin transporter FmnP